MAGRMPESIAHVQQFLRSVAADRVYFSSSQHLLPYLFLLFRFKEDFSFPGSELQEFSEFEQLEEEAEHNVFSIGQLLKERQERWREAEVHIAVAGDSGAGKPSFIDTIRG